MSKRWRELLIANDDDDEDDLYDILFHEAKRTHGGGAIGRTIRKRDIALGHANLLRDYLGASPVYDEDVFRRR